MLAARVDESRVPPLAPARPGRAGRAAAAVAYPPAGGRERRGHAAPARPRRRLGRRALGPGDLPVPGLGRLGGGGRPADHRAAPAAAARPGAGGRPAHRRDPGARRAGRPALGRADRRHPGPPAATGGCWSAASWPTTGTTPAACSPTAPCSPRPRSTCGGCAAGCRPATAADLLVEASEGEPSEQHLYRVRHGHRRRGRGAPAHAATRAGTSASRRRHCRRRRRRRSTTRCPVDGADAGDGEVGAVRSLAADAAVRAAAGAGTGDRPAAAGGGALPAQPRGRAPAAGAARHLRRPGAPGGGRRAVAPGWSGSGGPTPGFAVVTIDNRGTPGVAPSFEKAIHRRLADVILDRPGRRADRAGRQAPGPGPGPGGDPGLVVRRLAGRAGGAAPPGALPVRDRRRAGHRLDPLRHRVHRALPGPAGRRRRTSTPTTRWSSWPPSRSADPTRPGRCCSSTAWWTTTWWPRTRCGCRRRCWPPAGRTR